MPNECNRNFTQQLTTAGNGCEFFSMDPHFQSVQFRNVTIYTLVTCKIKTAQNLAKHRLEISNEYNRHNQNQFTFRTQPKSFICY